ncbi:hypothetical protein [Enterococcus faecalis]|uniref:Uncharacterized protein n=1 Tax=Enterococcus phage vB_EfaS_IME196 TaxID=1747289 RepID=A0A0S2MY90_9CAUD|nr:hypothetical protein [Enterococcus faecalis]YP_009216631.1 hypothetical protein AVT93_gp44 [Enterococcus phage vB_EfaS_IME196]ALO80912.1 hypothetical protein [Enterococcus phage vB_EfaS_IME196]MCH1677416.1 hypothetical protein [Enterococcus faecalis]MCH1680208.1 hypothetical protein [Enterococcus faecalis]
MITKENYENVLQNLNERFDKLKAEMIEAYEKGDNEKGHRLNDRLESILDAILLTETTLDKFK